MFDSGRLIMNSVMICVWCVLGYYCVRYSSMFGRKLVLVVLSRKCMI